MNQLFVRKDREFYQKTVTLMLPVILQQLITIGINFNEMWFRKAKIY